jgi:CheY-like chemotaxis protein
MEDESTPAAHQPEQRVLVADDSADERQALAHLLRQAGYQVDEADDGEAAILFLKQKLPDLLLLDLQMPGTDGFGVLSYIQKNKQNFPVILLSGLPPDQIQKSMQRLPSRDLPPLLLKPVDPNQLLNIVAMRLTGELPS